MAEIERIHSRLGALTAEQLAAVEALTRGLVNKFLHPPMRALKQAAREGDSCAPRCSLRRVGGAAGQSRRDAARG